MRMAKTTTEGERNLKCTEEDNNEEDKEEDFRDLVFMEDDKKRMIMTIHLHSKKGAGSRAGGSTPPTCQVDYCNADLTHAKHYHKRHKVCEAHAKAPSVSIAGLQQRFCQQCSRFHGLLEFDDNKRSCRRRLAGHNERRRKNSSSNYHGEGVH